MKYVTLFVGCLLLSFIANFTVKFIRNVLNKYPLMTEFDQVIERSVTLGLFFGLLSVLIMKFGKKR
ncbi:hypothetical protein [Alkalicoccobacillus murimartini]|uniref:Uncharacterized protein n=1 Tax=Alkalicoccobacillus murimartini TaxID=171685 RepID=A0ABT9YK57_9BACI|nr:hypothetical protein [Alkalicoccobacillus murimartini]MDQ0207597.1 hypothetical protein [Alkalicoccobacillus murimartini]